MYIYLKRERERKRERRAGVILNRLSNIEETQLTPDTI